MESTDLKSKLRTISSVFIPPLEEGYENTIKEFYSNCVEPTLPSVWTVQAWQRLLIDYANDPEAIFFLRRNASAPNNDWLQIRRGFLTEYSDGSGYVFCDNFYAHYIFAMALDGFVPTFEDFKQSIIERSFPYGFMTTKEELPLQAYSKGKNPGINNAGWKLAHLYSVNGGDYSFNYRSVIEPTFPRGSRDEWKKSPNGDYVSRYLNRPISDREKQILRAHFLRLSSPLNYFLVPKVANETDDLGGNIGESRKLLCYVYSQFEKRYGKLMHEYENLIFDGSNYQQSSGEALGSTVINVRYGSSVVRKQAKTPRDHAALSRQSNKQTAKHNSPQSVNSVSEDQLHIMARLYLEKAVSFRNLERQVLGIDSAARGGGFIAKTALNNFGITAENKGALRYKTAKAESLTATGAYLLALRELYNLED